MRKLFLALMLTWLPALPAQEAGRILRPEDASVLAPGEISVVAAGPAEKLELDGQALSPEEPFPNVYHVRITPLEGRHTLALVWQGGRHEISFFVGDDPPPGFRTFRTHPPQAVACTQCHGLSRRGRFRFQGGCFDCHPQEPFVHTHQHPIHILEECGQCHNAHGSTASAHLILPRERACKLCHN